LTEIEIVGLDFNILVATDMISLKVIFIYISPLQVFVVQSIYWGRAPLISPVEEPTSNLLPTCGLSQRYSPAL
jgi:hypothetical protein